MSCGDALIAGRRLAYAFIGGPVRNGSSAAWRVTAVRRVVSHSRSNRTGGSDRGTNEKDLAVDARLKAVGN
jgi:hypothetical protein